MLMAALFKKSQKLETTQIPINRETEYYIYQQWNITQPLKSTEFCHMLQHDKPLRHYA